MDQTTEQRRETERVAALERYAILDSANEAVFDDVAQLAATICQTPIALVSFIDRTPVEQERDRL